MYCGGSFVVVVSVMLTQDENGDSIKNCSNVGQQPHDHSQLGEKQETRGEPALPVVRDSTSCSTGPSGWCISYYTDIHTASSHEEGVVCLYCWKIPLEPKYYWMYIYNRLTDWGQHHSRWQLQLSDLRKHKNGSNSATFTDELDVVVPESFPVQITV